MLHIDILIRLARALGRKGVISSYEERAKALSAHIKASVPYHLAANLDEYIHLINTGVSNIPPNRPVGGLLLLHPLYAAARCTAIPHSDRLYHINCLAWIGSQMGIGQATLLANSLRSELLGNFTSFRPPELPFMDMGEGHILVWV